MKTWPILLTAALSFANPDWLQWDSTEDMLHESAPCTAVKECLTAGAVLETEHILDEVQNILDTDGTCDTKTEVLCADVLEAVAHVEEDAKKASPKSLEDLTPEELETVFTLISIQYLQALGGSGQ